MAAIEKLATLFGVPATYLMGWEEKESHPSEPQLTGVDKELWEVLKVIPEEQKRLFLEMGRAFAKSLNKD